MTGTGVPCPAAGRPITEPGSPTWPAVCPTCRRYLDVDVDIVADGHGGWTIGDHHSHRPIDITTWQTAKVLRRLTNLHAVVTGSPDPDDIDLGHARMLLRDTGLDGLIGTGALPHRRPVRHTAVCVDPDGNLACDGHDNDREPF